MIKSKGILVIEAHIETPKESDIFQKYPRILDDHFATDFICDTLRMLSMNLDDPHQVFDAMEGQLEKHHHEAMKGQEALPTTADGLPAIGIVAAVLGVIKTMASVTEPPKYLEHLSAAPLRGRSWVCSSRIFWSALLPIGSSRFLTKNISSISLFATLWSLISTVTPLRFQ